VRRVVWVTAAASLVLVVGAIALELITVTDRRGLIAVNDVIPPSVAITNLAAGWVGVMLTAGLACGIFSIFVLALDREAASPRR
jgi:hypothetical protein